MMGRLDTELVPMHSDNAEKALLGGILLDNDVHDDCASIVSARDFYYSRNEKAFRAMTEMIQSGKRCDAVTLAEELIRKGWMEECGGPVFIVELMDTVHHTTHSVHYARIVRKKSDLRNARDVLLAGLRDVNAGPEDVAEIVHSVDSQLMKILEHGCGTTDIHIGYSVPELLSEIDRRSQTKSEVSGLACGFQSIDKLTTGFHPAAFVLLAARPSMGKTALVGNWAYNMVTAGKIVLFISLEQSTSEILERLISAAANVDAHALKTGQLNERERDAVQSVAEIIKRLPLFVDDAPEQTVQQIRATARRTQRKHGLDAIIIDYVQIVTPENRYAPREQQVADISRRLKALAKELKVPVIVLAQLNRGVEGRADHTPKLADLRESGSLEQDSDVVCFLNRPERYDAADRPGVAEISIAKNRNGMCGMVELEWQGSWMRFVDSDSSDPSRWIRDM